MDKLTQDEIQIIINMLKSERHHHGDIGYEVMTEIIRKLQE